MNDLEVFQQIRQSLAHCFINYDRSKTSADHKYNGFVSGESAQIHGCDLISGEKFLTDRRSGEDCLILWKALQSFRKVAADLCSRRYGNLIRKSGSHIRLMDDHRNLAPFAGKNDRNGDESSFGEDHIRFQVLDQDAGFMEALQNTERIREVLHAEVAAQLSGRNSVIRDAERFDQFLFNPVVGTYVMYIITKLPQTGEKSNIRSDMSGGASAG